MHIYMCIYMYICKYVFIYTYIYTCTYICIYIFIYLSISARYLICRKQLQSGLIRISTWRINTHLKFHRCVLLPSACSQHSRVFGTINGHASSNVTPPAMKYFMCWMSHDTLQHTATHCNTLQHTATSQI